MPLVRIDLAQGKSVDLRRAGSGSAGSFPGRLGSMNAIVSSISFPWTALCALQADPTRRGRWWP